jgi:hypothetical protein
MAGYTGIAGEMKRLRTEADKLQKAAVGEISTAALVLVEAFMSRTPVWSGETVINYTFSAVTRAAPGPGTPGTNNMPLGSEPNRAAAEAPPRAEANALKSLSRLVDVTFTNSGPTYDLVETGAAPTRDRARNPGNLSKVALGVARAKLEHWK